jgi:hypothetical protein
MNGIQTNKDVSKTLSKIGSDLKWDVLPPTPTMEVVREQVLQAQQKLNMCRKEASTLCQSFLDERIEAAAKAEDTATGKLLKKLRHREAQSACFKKLAYALHPSGSKSGVTKVELKVEGTTLAFTEKKDVERETKKRNKAHFNQPAGSPFTIYPLSELGTTPDTHFKTNTLPDGQAVKMPADTFLETQTILDLLQRPLPGAKEANISSRISLSDFTSAIKAWNEKTSTSPSGRHLGHYKLLVKTLEDPNTTDEIKQSTEDILKLLVSIMDLACDKGFYRSALPPFVLSRFYRNKYFQ